MQKRDIYDLFLQVWLTHKTRKTVKTICGLRSIKIIKIKNVSNDVICCKMLFADWTVMEKKNQFVWALWDDPSPDQTDRESLTQTLFISNCFLFCSGN